MKKYFLPLLTLIIFGCAHSPRNPNYVNFSDVEKRIQAEIAEDQKLVFATKHATKLYSHGYQTERSILIMHGMQESPEYMKGFAEYFFNKGYNVLSLRLPAHMTINSDDLNHVKAHMWVSAAEKAFHDAQELGVKTEVLGYSLGGTLAAYLALNYPGQIKNLYLVAPALALSFRTFLSSTLLGWTKKDLSSVCSTIDSKKLLCRAILSTDSQLKPMAKEGIYSSPAAGFQVQNLINFIDRQFNPEGELASIGKRNYYQMIEETYLQMKVPIVMINSESDTVVSPRFNDELMNKYQYPHKQLLFNKSLGISHLMLNKSKMDAFTTSPEIYNPYFNEMIELIERQNK